MNLLSFQSYILLITLLFAATPSLCQKEIFIQLEDDLTQNYYRYYPGDKIEFRTSEFPDSWRKAKITKILPEDGIIVLKEGYVKVKDITRIRRAKGKGGKILGAALLSFGPGVVVYGTLGNLADGNAKGAIASALIGGLISGIGWLISRSGRRKKYTIGKHTRLRIYDIRWIVPDQKPKPKA